MSVDAVFNSIHFILQKSVYNSLCFWKYIPGQVCSLQLINMLNIIFDRGKGG